MLARSFGSGIAEACDRSRPMRRRGALIRASPCAHAPPRFLGRLARPTERRTRACVHAHGPLDRAAYAFNRSFVRFAGTTRSVSGGLDSVQDERWELRRR